MKKKKVHGEEHEGFLVGPRPRIKGTKTIVVDGKDVTINVFETVKEAADRIERGEISVEDAYKIPEDFTPVAPILHKRSESLPLPVKHSAKPPVLESAPSKYEVFDRKRERQPKTVTGKCENCGNDFSYKPHRGRVPQRRFCKRSCASDYVWKHSRAEEKIPMDQVVADYQSGMSIPKVAKKYSLSNTGVSDALHRSGIEMRDHTSTQICIEEGCGGSVYKRKLATGVEYGTRCKKHDLEYRQEHKVSNRAEGSWSHILDRMGALAIGASETVDAGYIPVATFYNRLRAMASGSKRTEQWKFSIRRNNDKPGTVIVKKVGPWRTLVVEQSPEGELPMQQHVELDNKCALAVKAIWKMKPGETKRYHPRGFGFQPEEYTKRVSELVHESDLSFKCEVAVKTEGDMCVIRRDARAETAVYASGHTSVTVEESRAITETHSRKITVRPSLPGATNGVAPFIFIPEDPPEMRRIAEEAVAFYTLDSEDKDYDVRSTEFFDLITDLVDKVTLYRKAKEITDRTLDAWITENSFDLDKMEANQRAALGDLFRKFHAAIMETMEQQNKKES